MVNLNTDEPDDEPTEEELYRYELAQVLNQAAAEFDSLCAERHTKGQEEYGELTFLGNDIIRMMLEELADTTNYCRMQAVKLLMLQARFEAEIAPNINDGEGQAQLGFQSFKGTKEGWSK